MLFSLPFVYQWWVVGSEKFDARSVSELAYARASLCPPRVGGHERCLRFRLTFMVTEFCQIPLMLIDNLL